MSECTQEIIQRMKDEIKKKLEEEGWDTQIQMGIIARLDWENCVREKRMMPKQEKRISPSNE